MSAGATEQKRWAENERGPLLRLVGSQCIPLASVPQSISGTCVERRSVLLNVCFEPPTHQTALMPSRLVTLHPQYGIVILGLPFSIAVPRGSPRLRGCL
ncbi:hypothetical protein HDV62DRAFT_66667 [Trichoderma sp. SZMC 28011]